jgi:hypothetical protein
MSATSGADAKALLRRHRIDGASGEELAMVRRELTIEERF